MCIATVTLIRGIFSENHLQGEIPFQLDGFKILRLIPGELMLEPTPPNLTRLHPSPSHTLGRHGLKSQLSYGCSLIPFNLGNRIFSKDPNWKTIIFLDMVFTARDWSSRAYSLLHSLGMECLGAAMKM